MSLVNQNISSKRKPRGFFFHIKNDMCVLKRRIKKIIEKINNLETLKI